MKTISKKRPTRPTTSQSKTSVSQELQAIQNELACIKGLLRSTPSCSSSRNGLHLSGSDTRYLSETEAAEYEPVSSHLSDATDTIRFCQTHFQLLIERGLQEELHVLSLNGAHRVIRSHQVTVGILNSTPVHPREVFRPAIVDAAASIILVHNHPSGSPKPSTEDLKVTESIEAAGKLVGIKLIDHIIVARERCTSIFEWRTNGASFIG